MEELDQANEDLGSANENRQLLRDELRDIKLLLVSSDKELQAARSAASNSAVSSTAELAQAQAEVCCDQTAFSTDHGGTGSFSGVYLIVEDGWVRFCDAL